MLWAIAAAPADGAAPRFVRAGLLLDLPAEKFFLECEGKAVRFNAATWDDRRLCLEFAWTPGKTYQLVETGRGWPLRAPRNAAPERVQAFPRGDVSAVAATGAWPDAVVRFAPDSRRLAIGDFLGELSIVDAYTGQRLHAERISEGYPKRLAWAPDGSRLYVGAQSPDGELFALDATPEGNWRRLWTYRTANRLGTSRPPAEDRFGVYTLPGVFDLHVAHDGRLLLAAVHNAPENGRPRNRSLIACLAPDGEVRWTYPPAGRAPVTIAHLAVDEAGEQALFLASQSQEPTPDSALRADTVYRLDGATGALRDSLRIEPLRPHYARVESWDSITLSDNGAQAALGLSDGRALRFSCGAEPLRLVATHALATPLDAGGIPVAAPCSYARFLGDELFLQTQTTNIPAGSSQTAQQPPAAHPGAETLTVVDGAGATRWRWRLPFAPGGQWSDRLATPQGTGRWLLVPCRPRPGAAEGQYGALLFDRRRAGSGPERLVYYYPTVGPVMFQADVSPDGRLWAVVETPTPSADGRELLGAHQVHVVH